MRGSVSADERGPKMSMQRSTSEATLVIQTPGSQLEQPPRKSLLTQLILLLAPNDDAASAAGMMALLPLRFRDKHLEEAFSESLRPSYGRRAILVAAFLSLTVSLWWIVFGFFIRTSLLPVPHWVLVTAFHTSMAVTLLCSLSIGILKFWQSKSAEFIIYALSLPSVIVWPLWVTLASSTRTQKHVEDKYGASLIAFTFKMWTDTVIMTFYGFILIVYDQFMQTRGPSSMTVHLILIALFTAFRISQIKMNLDLVEGTVAKSFVVTECVQCIAVIGLSLLAYIGRARKELVERINFVRLTETQKRLHRLREKQQRRRISGGEGETIVEKLTRMIKRCQLEFRELAFQISSHGDSRMLEADEVLRQCIDVLMNTDQLFSLAEGNKTLKNGVEDDLVDMFSGATRKIIGAHLSSTGVELGLDLDPEPAKPSASPDLNLKDLTFDLFDLNPFEVDYIKTAADRPSFLRDITLALVRSHVDSVRIKLPCMYHFMSAIEAQYLPNPYHNGCHGGMVAYMAYHLLQRILSHQNLTSEEITQVTLAGACHDVGHPGKNNNFYITEGKTLTLLYNDSAVLESYHCFLTFRTAQMRADNNIFAGMTPALYTDFRKRLVELILATDMAQHFTLVSRLRLRRNSEAFDTRSSPEDRWSAIRICIKTADLSHAFVRWDFHLDWSLRINEEFAQQGDLEKSLNMPVSPLCSRSDFSNFAKSQTGFLQFVLLPLAEELTQLDGSSSRLEMTHPKDAPK